MSSGFDLVVRNGLVVTEAATVEADVGVAGGRIAAIGRGLERGVEEIDAAGRLVLPGRHRQPLPRRAGIVDRPDDRRRFPLGHGRRRVRRRHHDHPVRGPAPRPEPARRSRTRYRGRARDKAVVDYAFHLIVSDPTPAAVGEHLPALIAEGYPSFKVYTTYDALKLTDRQLLDVMALAARERAVVMVHAENSDAIAWAAERLVAAGHTAPRYHAESRPVGGRTRGGAPGRHARRPDWRDGPDRPRVVPARRSTRSARPGRAGCRSSPRPARSTSR